MSVTAGTPGSKVIKKLTLNSDDARYLIGGINDQLTLLPTLKKQLLPWRKIFL